MARNIGFTQNHAGNQIEDFRLENLAIAPAAGKAGRPFYNSSTALVGYDNGSAFRYLAPTDSPAFSGNPTAPTQTSGDNSTRLATTAFVQDAIGTATGLGDNTVTNAKLSDMAANTIKGRITGGTGDPEDLTAANVRTIINVENGATANSSDATLLARGNHTGTQPWSTLTGTPTTLSGYGITDATGGRVLNNSDNLDNLIGTFTASWTSGSQPTNNPASGSFVMMQIEHDSNTKFQIAWIQSASSNTIGDTYARSRLSGTWSAWRKLNAEDIADITGLQAALNAKAAISHTHTASQVTDFNTAVDTRVVAYWDSIAGADANVDTIRELLDLVLSNQSGLANVIGRFNADFGNGSATSYAITHNLNSLDVSVEIYRKSDGATFLCDVVRTNVNVVTIGISPAPASNSMRIVVKK